MNSIKTYLLPLVLLLFTSFSLFAQTDLRPTEEKLSKTDSILVNCYFTEQDYKDKHHVQNYEVEELEEVTYEDELYNNKVHKKRGNNTFWENVPAELVVDVVVNTLFFVALLWQ